MWAKRENRSGKAVVVRGVSRQQVERGWLTEIAPEWSEAEEVGAQQRSVMAVLARVARKIQPEPKAYIGVALPKAKVWRFFSKLIFGCTSA